MENNILYHYTHKNALLSIIKNKCIWATDYKYLNLESEIQMLCRKVRQYVPDDVYTQKIADLSYSLPINKGIFCLSEKGDLLSQWIRYGEYAIGFNMDKLNYCLENQDFHKARPCIYKEDDLKKKITDFKENDDYADMEYFLSLIELLYKNSRYDEECEWRVISSSLPITTQAKEEKWKVRITPSKKIVEYTEINIDEFFPIEKIIVSSEKDFDSERVFLEKFLEQNGINNTEVIKSSIPFRKI
ncbi:MAG: DUF2971 domain-containing protein [Clostridium sp.]